jgi:hypothetical protein
MLLENNRDTFTSKKSLSQSEVDPTCSVTFPEQITTKYKTDLSWTLLIRYICLFPRLKGGSYEIK